MTIAEIIEERNALMEDQLRQSEIMKDSDAHACKCQKLGMNFQETYPDEYIAYIAANTKWHENEERIKELDEMVPEEEEPHEEIEG